MLLILSLSLSLSIYLSIYLSLFRQIKKGIIYVSDNVFASSSSYVRNLILFFACFHNVG